MSGVALTGAPLAEPLLGAAVAAAPSRGASAPRSIPTAGSRGWPDEARDPGREPRRPRPADGRPDQLLRPLRLLPADLPDLRDDGRGDGLAARSHLPDEGGARGQDGGRAGAALPRQLPRLPGLRDRLPFGGPLRRPDHRRSAAAPSRSESARPPSACAASWRSARSPTAAASAPRRSSAASVAGSAPVVPKTLRPMVDLLPEQLPPARPLPASFAAEGPRRARVALLAGCVQQVLDPEIGWATGRVLARNGVEVIVPSGQGCCGSLAMHAGEADGARKLARRNLDAFPEDVDAVITTAAGCGSGMREYGALFLGEPEQEAAERLAARTLDVTEFLAELGLAASPPALSSPLAIAYHDACHLAHAQKVTAAPRRLLAAIEGVDAARARRGRALLRLGRHLQRRTARGRRRARRAQGPQPPGDRRRADRQRQHRLPHPAAEPAGRARPPRSRPSTRAGPRPRLLTNPLKEPTPPMPDVTIADTPLDERSRTEILSADALAFLAELHGRFDARRRELLGARAERRAEIAAGGEPRLPARDPRDPRGHLLAGGISRAPTTLDRRVEITGPTDRKLVINALNSGAKGFMADFEDANSPTWVKPGLRPRQPDRRDRGDDHLRELRRPPLRAERGDRDAAGPPARLAPARAPPLASTASRAPARWSTSASSPSTAPRGSPPAASAPTSTCRSSSTTSRRASGTRCSTFAEDALGLAARILPRHRPDRDASPPPSRWRRSSSSCASTPTG